MEVKSLLVRIGTDISAMKAGFKKADTLIQKNADQIKKVGRAMTVAGGAITGAIGLMVKGYVKAGDEVHKMALRTGFSTESLSELKYAAEISGASLSDLEKGAKRMAKTITDADEGMATYIRAFDRIGIEVEELKGLSPEQQFDKIAKAIAAVEDPTVRAATAQDIFGRAGTKLLPLFAAGEEGLDALRQKARDMGIVFDQEAANKAATLQDAMTTLKDSVRGVTTNLASQLAPTITSIAEKISAVAQKVKDWIKEHPKLAGVLLKVVAGVGALMAVLGPLLILLPALSTGFSMLIGPVGIVIGVITGLIALAPLVIKNWGKIKEFFSGLWKSVTGFFVNAINAIKKKILDWAIDITGILEKIPIVKKLAGPWKESLEKMRAEMDRTVANVDSGAKAISASSIKIGKAWVGAIQETKFFKDAAVLLSEKGVTLSSVLTLVNGGLKEITRSSKDASDGLGEVGEEFEVVTEIVETQLHPALSKLGPITQQAVLAMMLGTGLLKEDLMNLSAIFPEELEPSALNTFEIIENKVAELRDRTFEGNEEIKRHWRETFDDIAACVSTAINGLDSAFSQAYENQMIRIDNEEKRTLEAIDNKYDATIEANRDIVEAEKAKTKEILKTIEDDYKAKKQHILDNVKDEEKRDALLAALEEQHGQRLEQARTDREIAEQEAADALAEIEEAKNEALRIASEELEKKREDARKTAAKQEKAVALLSAIVNTAAAVVKALPNIPLAIAVGAMGAIQIALIKAKPIPLKEGGVVMQRTIAEIGEAGPELVLPLNKLQPALAGGLGGFKMYNYFYGDINNAGDLDEISKRLAERTRRALERGR